MLKECLEALEKGRELVVRTGILNAVQMRSNRQ